MFLHRIKSSYGRIIPKPQKDEKFEEILDEAIPIQDQIEALRTKIQLKERYNKVLKEELEESRLGASTVWSDLHAETSDLEVQLNEAMNAEKAAVHSALRTHREFQLAMTDKIPSFAIGWLDDKLFDLHKILNGHVHRLLERRKALEDAENVVKQIEKWPRPGTLPFEVDAIENFHRLESMIEKVKVMVDTTTILNTNYHKVKHILREEKGRYAPIIRGLDEQVHALKNEKAILQKMLDDAVIFAEDAHKNVGLTEKEASENRKERRQEMTKMKKAMKKVLKANQASRVANTANRRSIRKGYLDIKGEDNPTKMEFLEKIQRKRFEIEVFEARTRRLVDTMRVPDLTFIPVRYRSIRGLGDRLISEMHTKARLRDLLLRQKHHLQLVLCHFSYTGQVVCNEYKTRIEAYNLALKEIETNGELHKHHIRNYGDIMVTLRFLVLALLDRLEEGRRRHVVKDFLPDTIRSITTRVKRLVGVVNRLEGFFTEPPEKNYGLFIKNPIVSQRLIRVGTPEQSEEESDDDQEAIDMKTPSRGDIKAKAAKEIAQAKLRGAKC